MKNFFRADCTDVMNELLDEGDEDYSSLLRRLQIKIHLHFCPDCSAKLKRLEICRDLIRSGFFPPSPSFENRIMEQLSDELDEDEYADAAPEVPGGISFRSWVIIGFFILISLPSSFFGMDLFGLASKYGTSLLLPLGITTGIMLTGYGAFFIGSHLKELSDRFNLH